MFPNTEGSSQLSATGTPLFKRTGNGCMGMDDVKRCIRTQFSRAPIFNLKIHIPILHSLISYEKGSKKTTHDIRNWAYFHGNALLPTSFDKFGMFSKRKSVFVMFINNKDHSQRCHPPMPNSLCSKENGVIKVQVRFRAVTQSFTRMKDKWDIDAFLFLALAKA